MIYDLHSHSTASDGRLTPTELVQRAVEKGVDVFSLTDHDTIAGLPEAREEAEKHNLQFINGVEISVLWADKAFHLTAHNFDATHPKLVKLLDNQTALREERAQKIAEKLEKAGVPNAYEGAKYFATGEITRAHYARFLLEQGLVRNMDHAFKRYLGLGKRAYVKPLWCSMEEAIEAVHEAGGVISVAHPLRYKLTACWVRRLLIAFKEAGGDGMEVADCGQSPDQRQLLARWSKEYDLLASVGSDFHYPSGWAELGKNLNLPKDCDPIWEQWKL